MSLIFLVFGATLGAVVTFFGSLEMTKQMVASEMETDGSVFYKLYASHLQTARDQYAETKALRQADRGRQ